MDRRDPRRPGASGSIGEMALGTPWANGVRLPTRRTMNATRARLRPTFAKLHARERTRTVGKVGKATRWMLTERRGPTATREAAALRASPASEMTCARPILGFHSARCVQCRRDDEGRRQHRSRPGFPVRPTNDSLAQSCDPRMVQPTRGDRSMTTPRIKCPSCGSAAFSSIRELWSPQDYIGATCDRCGRSLSDRDIVRQLGALGSPTVLTPSTGRPELDHQQYQRQRAAATRCARSSSLSWIGCLRNSSSTYALANCCALACRSP